MHTRTLLTLPLLAAALACGGTEETTSGDASRSLGLSFTGLPVLGASAVYEGWLIVGGAPRSTGRFTVGADGALSPSSFTVPAADADAATTFVLTIEPAVGDDPAPAETHVLAGDLSGGAATLSLGHAAALGADLSLARGTFILETPTSTATDDAALGIWYLDPSSGTPAPSLELPALPAGWIYEGWVVDLSSGSPQPVSTGRFASASGADDDGAGATRGPGGAPPFPGQDFITPARDLSSMHMAVISVEPVPDDSPAPFQVKPLAAMIDGARLGAMAPQSLENALGANTITGTATLR
jgi:hypothetical protein